VLLSTYYFTIASTNGAYGANGFTYIAAFAGTNKIQAKVNLMGYLTNPEKPKNIIYWTSEIKINKEDNILAEARKQLTSGVKPKSHKVYD
jgi:hypothetical protein